MPDAFYIITLDGGAASGKSSTARALAERLHLLHVDTGSHYRAVTYCLMESGLEPDDPCAIVAALHALELGFALEGNLARLTLRGTPLEAEQLRSEAVNQKVSAFSAIPEIRTHLKDYQRSFVEVAREQGFNGLVMEGRDIGSVILPDAPHKFFIEADPETRAARRAAEGQTDTIAARDAQDSKRKTAPLTCPEGAIRIDTSELSISGVVDKIVQLIDVKP